MYGSCKLDERAILFISIGSFVMKPNIGDCYEIHKRTVAGDE